MKSANKAARVHRPADGPMPLTADVRRIKMKKYRVILEGRNFLIEVDDKIGKYGFYQTFYIDADSPAEAENAAVQKVKNASDLKTTVLNPKNDVPMIHLDEIEEIGEFPKDYQPVTGRAWYPEDEENEASNKAVKVQNPAAGF